MIKLLNKCLFLLVSIFFLSGCVKINTNNLIPSNQKMKEHNLSVSINVDGGREKNPVFEINEISNEILKNAVIKSINKLKVFNKVSAKNSDYILDLFVSSNVQPAQGFDITSSIEIAWILKKENNLIWKKSIYTSSSKGIADIHSFDKRITIALEEATRDNIEIALKEISILKL